LKKEIEKLVDLYKLLNSGNYIYYNTVSFIDFIRVLRLVKFNKNFQECFKKSHIELISFLGIIEFLQNVKLVKLNKNKRITIQNHEIFELIYTAPSQKSIYLKIARKIPLRKYILKKIAFKSKINLLELYKPNFKLNVRSYQIPCSLRSSIKRAGIICNNIYFKTQKALFIGDDDLISILCKFIEPKLPITVIEIDGRITKLLKSVAVKHKFENFNVYNIDFKEFDEIKQHIDDGFSIVHLDPPYEVEELRRFTVNLSLMQDKLLFQIFLNGLYDSNCMSIISDFITKNKLVISDYFKSFNSYSFRSADIEYLKYMKKQLKLESNLKFKEKDIERIEFSSDLYIIEKSLNEQDIDSDSFHNII